MDEEGKEKFCSGGGCWCAGGVSAFMFLQDSYNLASFINCAVGAHDSSASFYFSSHAQPSSDEVFEKCFASRSYFIISNLPNKRWALICIAVDG